MTLVELLTRELAETKHYEVCVFSSLDPAIRCKCGYWLCKITHTSVTYENRHGPAILYAADPHFFDKLKKLLTELHRRQQRSQAAFEKKLRGK